MSKLILAVALLVSVTSIGCKSMHGSSKGDCCCAKGMKCSEKGGCCDAKCVCPDCKTCCK